MKVGLIGLGRMGKGMAHRIQGGGHELTVSMPFCEGQRSSPLPGAGRRFDCERLQGKRSCLTMPVQDSAIIDVLLRRRRHASILGRRLH